MIRTIIIALAIVLAVTGVALAWTGARDSDPGDPIQLPDARHEDTGIDIDLGDGEGDDGDDRFGKDDPDTSYSNDSSRWFSDTSFSDMSFSDTSFSSDSSIFKKAPRTISVIKPKSAGGVGDKPAGAAQHKYGDDSASMYSFDSSFDSSSVS